MVAPLEGLWSADDVEKFVTRAKDDWEWTTTHERPSRRGCGPSSANPWPG